MTNAFTVWAVPKLRTEGKGIMCSNLWPLWRNVMAHSQHRLSHIVSKVTVAIERLETGHSNEILRELCRGRTVQFREKFFRNDLYLLGFFTLS